MASVILKTLDPLRGRYICVIAMTAVYSTSGRCLRPIFTPLEFNNSWTPWLMTTVMLDSWLIPRSCSKLHIRAHTIFTLGMSGMSACSHISAPCLLKATIWRRGFSAVSDSTLGGFITCFVKQEISRIRQSSMTIGQYALLCCYMTANLRFYTVEIWNDFADPVYKEYSGYIGGIRYYMLKFRIIDHRSYACRSTTTLG